MIENYNPSLDKVQDIPPYHEFMTGRECADGLPAVFVLVHAWRGNIRGSKGESRVP